MEATHTNNAVRKKINIVKLGGDAHWHWMKLGWQDLINSWAASAKIGASVVLVSLAILLSLAYFGYGSLIPAAFGSFALVGPILASTIYGISKKLESERKVEHLREATPHPQSPTQLGIIGFALFFIILVWARVAVILYAVTTGLNTNMNHIDFINYVLATPQGIIMMVVGTIFGGILAIIGFSISAISIPLVYDRDIDAITAMALSVKAINKNPMAMFSWAFVISMLVAASAFFLFLPMIIIFPWLGHVTWHAYRASIEN